MNARTHNFPAFLFLTPRLRLAGLIVFSLSVLQLFSPFLQASRLKDLTAIEGGRDNQLVGYGIVVGLAGDGDSNANSTLHALSNILQRYGLSVSPTDIKAKNVAAVMI